MEVSTSPQVTQLLLAWRQGEKSALDQLIPLVHEELRRIARRYMMGERKGHSLQTTALVNEAYIRLAGSQKVNWQCRAHFFAVSAHLMRRVLVDHARAHNYQKRGGGAYKVTLDEATVGPAERGQDLLALDDALQELAKIDPRKGRVVELRFFGGMSVKETAAILHVSPDTVLRDWRLARAWLQREMTSGGRHDA